MEDQENPISKFSSNSNPNLENFFSFVDFNKNGNYIGLEEVYKDFGIFQPKEITTTTSIENLQQQEYTQPPLQEFNNSLPNPSLTFQLVDPPNKVIKRRKNQIEKMVHQMTEEQLLSDSWAWRKYGQKSIKGAPHPRHYYKCNLLKGCTAKKQVEQSALNSAVFLVSFYGNHTHASPAHRTSKYGGTRRRIPYLTDSSVPADEFTTPLSSAFAPTLPPTTHPTGAEIEDDDNVIMIPNTLMAEEMLRGFQEINDDINMGRCSVYLGYDTQSDVGKLSGEPTSSSAAFDGVF